ncbi:MAG: sulfotransferase [Planctomycetota bacterium]
MTGSLRHALLLGQGRSGTNYLLALLNQSPYTHCRNEPDELEDSSLRQLTPFRFFVDDPEELDRRYDAAIRGAALTVGPRDHIVRPGKAWLYPGSCRPGFFYLRNRYRLVHRILRQDLPMWGRERPFPRWMTSTPRLEKAFHVFKLNAAVGIAGWVFEHRREVKAVHIVRHPGGFAKSWLKRWVGIEMNRDPARARENERVARARLADLAARDATWARRLGDVLAMDPIEMELWWWRFCGERTWEAGHGRPGYHRVIYEELTEDPVAVARGVYEFCGLPWDDWLASRVASISSSSREIAAAWKDELDAAVVRTIERVLEGSPLAAWWGA